MGIQEMEGQVMTLEELEEKVLMAEYLGDLPDIIRNAFIKYRKIDIKCCSHCQGIGRIYPDGRYVIKIPNSGEYCAAVIGGEWYFIDYTGWKDRIPDDLHNAIIGVKHVPIMGSGGISLEELEQSILNIKVSALHTGKFPALVRELFERYKVGQGVAS